MPSYQQVDCMIPSPCIQCGAPSFCWYGGFYYCRACYNNNFFVCANCSNQHILSERHYFEGGALCSYCYREFVGTRQQTFVTWPPAVAYSINSHDEVGSDRCYGIELETSECPNYRTLHGHTDFGAKYDCSVKGLEFFSPIMQGDKGLKSTREFCTEAKKLGFKVDSDCGYHLHIDMRTASDYQKRAIAYAYILMYPIWVKFVNTFRAHDCSYCRAPDCQPRGAYNTNDINFWVDNQPRYRFINFASFYTHKTFEIRGYQGTLNPVEICNWIKAHLHFADYVKELDRDEIDAHNNWPCFKKILGPELARYYGRTRAKNNLTTANYMV